MDIKEKKIFIFDDVLPKEGIPINNHSINLIGNKAVIVATSNHKNNNNNNIQDQFQGFFLLDLSRLFLFNFYFNILFL